ncbi:TIGR02680 family protein [Vulgatibacter incomptus]|uniref:TIGR02680 family protein n=1 Tax=Vulgatibacter incomptus TaxID=1391653 RepID=A0A0K1PH64_9BACT|nr:TIGR02680 family protein [Vulgatibacter incomptus]AKU92736.1 Hypothetical protein AKJ08_3123 [Vulgatibacter incomptus]
MKVPLDLPVASTGRWQLLRAGIQNLWEYDDQRFVFHRGRLLLRGQNESGKTKALEVLLPFLLDANLQPSRLDPFGSTSRSMRWNLIGDWNPEANTSIGYVWLELGRVENGETRYCTVGAGLRARRASTDTDAWYFRTSQRIDVDLLLVEDRLPLERPALTKAIDARGQVYQQAAEYRRAVNDEIFGMEEEQYGSLIDALLQLRRPQLSKKLDPEELSQILSASLPPLDRTVVASLAEGFERLDKHRLERDDVSATLQTLRRFRKVYERYVASAVKAAAKDLTTGESSYHIARESLRKAEEELEALYGERKALAGEIAALDAERQELAARLAALRSSDGFRAVEHLADAERLAQQEETRAQREGVLAAKDREAERVATARLGEAEKERVDQGKRAEAARRSTARAAEDASLGQDHAGIDELFDRGELEAAASAIESLHGRREQHLARLRKLEDAALDARKRRDRAAQAFSDATDRAADFRDRLDRAEKQAQAVRSELEDSIGRWSRGLRVLLLDPDDVRELAPLETPERVRRAEEATRKALGDHLTAARLELEKVKEELEDRRREHDELAALTHRPPSAPAWRAPRPTDRPGAPLYLLCDFDDGVDETVRGAIEGALEAAGLLDAWVEPSGGLLDADTFDLVLSPAPLEGRTLLDVLRPMEGPVPAPVVETLLSSIALTDDGPGGEES